MTHDDVFIEIKKRRQEMIVNFWFIPFLHVVQDKCYVFSFGNTTKLYSLSWQEAHEIEPNSVEQIKELLMLVAGWLTEKKKIII